MTGDTTSYNLTQHVTRTTPATVSIRLIAKGARKLCSIVGSASRHGARTKHQPIPYILLLEVCSIHMYYYSIMYVHTAHSTQHTAHSTQHTAHST
jgi:hypothetical protein